MIPSDSGRRRLSIGYLRCKMRNAGAIASGLALSLSTAWPCAMDTSECQTALCRG